MGTSKQQTSMRPSIGEVAQNIRQKEVAPVLPRRRPLRPPTRLRSDASSACAACAMSSDDRHLPRISAGCVAPPSRLPRCCCCCCCCCCGGGGGCCSGPCSCAAACSSAQSEPSVIISISPSFPSTVSSSCAHKTKRGIRSPSLPAASGQCADIQTVLLSGQRSMPQLCFNLQGDASALAGNIRQRDASA